MPLESIDLAYLQLSDIDGSHIAASEALLGILTAVNHVDETPVAADQIAQQIDQVFVTMIDTADAQDTEASLWTLFSTYIKVVRRIAPQDPRLQLLVDTLGTLQQFRRGTVTVFREEECKLWGTLPLLGPCMREAWNFSPVFDGHVKTYCTPDEWTSLNSFCARVFAAGIAEWHAFAIWGLRQALEEEQSTTQERTMQVGVACEWIEHAGSKMRHLILIARDGKVDDRDKRALRTGSLLSNEKSGFFPERWRFWKASYVMIPTDSSIEVMMLDKWPEWTLEERLHRGAHGRRDLHPRYLDLVR